MTTAGLLFLAAVVAFLPQTDAPKAEFEVVSIKPFNPNLSQGGVASRTRNSKGRWEARNFRLKDLLLSAFSVNENQIVGAPKWWDSAGWDIDAKYNEGNQPRFGQMVQAMLADRFHLVFHRETRALPVYFLDVAKGGSKLKEAEPAAGGMSAGPRMIKYGKASMSELAHQLSGYFGRPVLDRTSLHGDYEINLRFAPVNASASVDAAEAETLPSIFRALEEQLGLKLEAGKGPVEVLVIDRVDKPTGN